MKKRKIILCLLSAIVPLSLASLSFAAVNAPVVVTGQNTCWDSSGNVISCAGTGQDGALQKGVAFPTPRFVDNNDGTLTDSLTGLTWLKNANCNPSAGTTWSGAITWARTLASGSCGLTDGSTAGQWRVPNVNELFSLIDQQQSATRNWLQSQGFVNVNTSNYCTSTTSAANPTQVWTVSTTNAGGGGVQPAFKSYGCGGVFAVRGGDSGTYLSLNVTKNGHGTGTVTPNLGTLTWTGMQGQARYPISSSVTLTATPDSGSVFSGWSGACSGTDVCTVTMDTVKSVTATFGENATCGSATTVYTAPAPTQNLCSLGTASTPVLTGNYWSWTCSGYEGGGSVTCSTPPPPTFPLTVSVTSGSGTIHSTPPPDINCSGTCVKNYDQGTLVTLTAQPNPSNVYIFSGWSGACSGTGYCSVAMNQAQTVGAAFIRDTVPPVLSLPANMTLEATSPNGAVATFVVTATDNLDPNPTVSCAPASGSVFPFGTTQVICTATDAAGNTTPATPANSFSVTVRDTTPPVLNVPADIDVVLNTPVTDPAVVAFLNGATATDIADLTPGITHSDIPPLNTVGSKVVTFTAVDNYNNTTTRTATIHVIYGCGDPALNGQMTDGLPSMLGFKAGSTIPVQVHLCDATGADVTTAVARFYIQPYCGTPPTGDPIDLTGNTGADTGHYFKAGSSNYTFNLGTQNLGTGMYQIQAVLDDATVRTIPFALQ